MSRSSTRFTPSLLFAAATLAIACPVDAQVQPPDRVAVGDQVRVRTADRRLTGVLKATTPSALEIERSGESFRIERGEIERLEVASGTRFNPGRALGLGAATTMGTFMVGFVLIPDDPTDDSNPETEALLLSMVTGPAVFLTMLFVKSTGWQDVTDGPSIAPDFSAERGIGVSMTIPWS